MKLIPLHDSYKDVYHNKLDTASRPPHSYTRQKEFLNKKLCLRCIGSPANPIYKGFIDRDENIYYIFESHSKFAINDCFVIELQDIDSINVFSTHVRYNSKSYIVHEVLGRRDD